MLFAFRASWLACLLSLCSPLAAQEWSRFRGPNGTGVSEAVTVPVSWTEKDYNWRTELPGEGHSSPVLWGNRIFLTSANEATAKRYALCLDAADGKTLWTREYDSSKHAKHKLNSYASATAAADESQVYFVWSTPEAYTLAALDHAGKEVWIKNLGPFISQHSCGISPIVFEDLVILGNEQDLEGGGKSFIAAFDRKTGEQRWKLDRTSAVVAYSTPCLHQPKNGPLELIFNSQAHGISGVDPRTGKVNWEVANLFDKRSCSSSLMAGGLLIGTCGSGGGGNYVVAIHPGGTGEPTAGQLAWKLEKSAPYVPTPIALGELLFLWSDQGVVTCVKAQTGEILWTNRVGGNFYGSPICVSGRLYCVDTRGVVNVVAAAESYQLLAKNDLKEPSHSTPAVAGGKLYLRTVSHLISVGGKK